MAGFVFNILSEQSLGLAANNQRNTSDPSAFAQFKQVLQQTSSESADFTKSLLADPVAHKSGKDFPIDLSFYQQSFAGEPVIKDDGQESTGTDLTFENKVTLKTNVLPGVVGSQLDADLISGLDNNKFDSAPEAKLNSSESLSGASQISTKNPINLLNIPGTETMKGLQSSGIETVVDEPLTKPKVSLLKGTEVGVSLHGPNIQSKTLDQATSTDQTIASAKSAQNPRLAESIGLALDEQRIKPLSQSALQDKKSQELKALDAIKNAPLMDGEDSLALKPENLKLDSFNSKLEQKNSSPNTGINQMATRLKNSMLIQGNITKQNSFANELSISEVDSSSSINKLTIPVNTDLTSNPLKQPENLIANSAIQSGLSLKRNFSPNLAARIQWVYQQAISGAEILMDPPELGPLNVKLTNVNGETNVLFQVSNPATKEAIEDNLAKLKELLSEQGINLGDTQVEQQQKNDEKENSNEQIATDSALETEKQNDQQVVQEQQGLLDTYI